MRGRGGGRSLRAPPPAPLHTHLHEAPLPGLQHRAGLLLAPADVVRLVVASEVLVQLAGTHEQEGALQGLCPGGGGGVGVEESQGSEWAGAPSGGLNGGGFLLELLGIRVWIPTPGIPLASPRGALPQQLSLGVFGDAPQQQFLLPVHEFVGKAMAAPTQLLSHLGSLEGNRRGLGGG